MQPAPPVTGQGQARDRPGTGHQAVGLNAGFVVIELIADLATRSLRLVISINAASSRMI